MKTANELATLTNQTLESKRQAKEAEDKARSEQAIQNFIDILLAQAEEASRSGYKQVRVLVNAWLCAEEVREIINRLKVKGFETDYYWLRYGQCGGDNYRVIEILWKG